MTDRPGPPLIVFAREPIPGQVKTRLAAEIGDVAACVLYEAFLHDLLGELDGGPFALHVAVAGDPQRFAYTFGLPTAACFAQVAGNLGERMEAAFRRLLPEDGARGCLVVGSDLPHLSQRTVLQAGELLGSADLVLGPARDGGYYLIGMRAPHPVFSGIEWSTEKVLAQTEARAVELGLRYAHLPQDFDVDSVDDLARLRDWLTSRESEVLPATRTALAAL